MTTLLVWALLAALPAVALVMTVVNVATWRRGRPGGEYSGRVSVLIPARDEAATIEACVRAALEGKHPVDEVLVYDDDSTDATPQILANLTEEFARLEVVEASPLPSGWVGKPHACHRLAEATTGDLLIFVDADTLLSEDGIARLAGLIEEDEADVVTAVPRQITVGFFERLVVPLLHLTYTSWFPLRLVSASSDARFLAANGQLMAVERTAYDTIGGFEAVRAEIVDDMAFCRRAKEAGLAVAFADGFHMARCRMYASAGEVWRGFSKNLYEGIGAHPLALIGVMALYAAAFVAPYLVAPLAYAMGASGVGLAATVGVGVNVALRAVLAARFRHPPEGIILHPVGVLALLAIAVNSFRWHYRDAIAWGGRLYARREARRGE
ncbi:MAG: glycosyltransferase [Persicimonas sp.]